MKWWRSHSHRTQFVARESITTCCYYLFPLKSHPFYPWHLVYLQQYMSRDVEDSTDTMCFTSPSLSPHSSSHFTNHATQKDSRFDRNTSLSAYPLSGASATYYAHMSAAIRWLFARGGSYDAPSTFDCPIANEEKALVTTASGAIEEG
jgi:hypothetical protein